MKKLFRGKQDLGITVIALVITIIILLILLGISIGIIIGSNGLFNQSKYAVDKYNNSANDENTELARLQNEVENLQSTREDVQVSGVPLGTVIAYYNSTAPTGYLACDGTEYNLTEHPEYSQLATFLGAETGATTFNTPDLRGEFLRGTGSNPTTGYSGAAIGTHQNGTDVVGGYFGSDTGCIYVGHRLYYTDMQNKADNWVGNSGSSYNYGNVSRRTESQPYSSTIGKGTSRPTNTSVLYCIKY